MTAAALPWPGGPHDLTDVLPPDVPRAEDDERVRRLLDAAVAAVDAPDVVFALTRHGRRTVMSPRPQTRCHRPGARAGCHPACA
ncbi:hypothetical protein RKD20_006139 [Streptomyces sp. SLBN-8D4]|jgi:hypothetical protein